MKAPIPITATFPKEEINQEDRLDTPIVIDSIEDKMGKCVIKGNYTLPITDPELQELIGDSITVRGATSIKVYGPNLRARSKNDEEEVWKPLRTESGTGKFLSLGGVGKNGE